MMNRGWYTAWWGTVATVADVTQVDKLLHGDENVVCADAGYTGVEKRSEHADREVIWQVAARRSTYKMLDKRSALYKAKRKIEKAKAQVRAKVEPPFRVIKRQFGYTKVRFRGLVRNTAQLDDAVCPVEPMDGPPTCWQAQERCACNAENGRRKVLATAESTEMSG